jgi:hypothetical protein
MSRLSDNFKECSEELVFYKDTISGTFAIKLFTIVIYEWTKGASVSLRGKLLQQPSLMFAGKARCPPQGGVGS